MSTTTITRPATKTTLRISAFRPLQKNTLQGFVTVEHASGLVLNDVAIHCRDGRWWASPPSRPILVEGRHALDENGKGRWQPIVGFRGRRLQDIWSQGVIAAFLEAYGEAPQS